MFLRLTCLTCVCLLTALAWGADDQSKGQLGGKKHVLPKAKDAAVIILDFKGGFTPPRKSEAPMLTILADGTVKMPARFEGQKEFESKLTADELNLLLDEIITEQKFFEIDLAKAQANAGPQAPLVADAPVTVIRVEADGQSKELKQYALGFGGQQSPELQRMAKVSRRLQRLFSTVQLGGSAELAKYLKLANEKLKAEHPQAEPLTLADFQGGGQDATGRKTATFHRQGRAEGAAAGGFTQVSIEHLPEQQPKLVVHHREGK